MIGRHAGTLAAAIAAALLLAGCGINAQKAIDDAFNVETNPIQPPPPTRTAPAPGAPTEADLNAAEPATQGDLEAAQAIDEAGSTSDSGSSEISVEADPLPAIPIETAESEARKTATDVARQQGLTVGPTRWAVSCFADAEAWTCSVSYASCAGNIKVSQDPATNAARATREDFACTP